MTSEMHPTENYSLQINEKDKTLLKDYQKLDYLPKVNSIGRPTSLGMWIVQPQNNGVTCV